MSKKPQYDPEEIRYPEQKIVESPLVPEMERSYIEYAMSVIVGRALPDVRDGLKPVHRRILYSMYESGLTHDKPFKKSATCVGDVLGKYHPHGDAAVYDALVRLAQDFSMRYCLVEGHGNFGSVDGDPPAAYRYTEARCPASSDEMLRDIEKDTVDWDPNFDETLQEPKVLPSRFPNLLVNGSSGIAVGMATNIPPHNLREVIDACIRVLDDPECTLSDLMEHIKGPDFPTRGIIMGRSGIRAAYATGRGRIVVRARTSSRSSATAAPASSSPRSPTRSTSACSSRTWPTRWRTSGWRASPTSGTRPTASGMRIVIELKRDANPQVVLNRLFAQTQLQTTFAINMLALVEVNGKLQPRILSLRHILDEYIAYPGADHHPPDPLRPEEGPGAGPPAGGPADRPGQHRRGHPHHPLQLRRRQGEPDGPVRPGRRPGPGHPGHAAQAPSRAWTGRSWRRSTRSWRRRSPTTTSSSPTRACSGAC